MKDAKYSPIIEDQADSNEDSERRAHLSFVRQDRRVIERMRSPQLRFHVGQIHQLCRWWIWASLAYVAVMVGMHVYFDFHTSQKSMFFGVVILTLTYAVREVSKAAASYIQTESHARVEKLVERTYFLLFTSATVSVILGVAYLITLF